MSKQKHARRHFWRMGSLFVDNALANNIVLIQALGLCPIIGAGVTLKNGVVLTLCTAVVLLPTGFIIATLGNHLAKWLRPAVYVTLSSLLLVGAAYVLGTYVSPELFATLHLFIPLLAVNMLYTRNMGVAGTAHPLAAVVDSLGSTVGFGLVICIVSALRELAVSKTLWDIPLPYEVSLPEAAAPFAAFILLGFMAALLQWSRRHITAYFEKKEAAVNE